MSSLKGQCHEMNNFLKVLKIKSELSVYETMVFWILIVKKNTLKFLLAYKKTLTNSGDFTGSHFRIFSEVAHKKPSAHVEKVPI
jgi:hypothetical protein